MITSKCDHCSYYMMDLQMGTWVCTASPMFDCDVYKKEHGLRECEEFQFMVLNRVEMPIKEAENS